MTTPVYVGALGRAGRYVGALTDTAIYFGLESLWPATNVMPSWVADTPFQSGTGALTVNFSATGRHADDFLVVAIESANQAVNAPPAGWQFLPGSPQATGTAAAAGGVRLTLIGRISDGTETTVAIPDTGNHTTAIGSVFRGVNPGLKINLMPVSNDITSVYWTKNGGAHASTTEVSGPDGKYNAYRLSFDAGNSWASGPDAAITIGAVYTVSLRVKAYSADCVVRFNAYMDDDTYSSDFSVTTDWQTVSFTFTATDSSVAMGLEVGDDGDAADIYWYEMQIEPGAVAHDPVHTTTAAVVEFAGINASGSAQASNATFTLPGVTPNVDQCLIAHFIANDRDTASMANLGAPVNASLDNLTKRFDQTVADGAGGGLALITGEKATAGATGNTTVTNAAANTNASITLAFAP